jgi:hypothetical protein
MIHTIWTHSGEYHSDDIASTVVLKELFPEAKIVRDRDVPLSALEDPGTLVYDVGGVYDPELNNFDHHNVQIVGLRPGYSYSSLGLIWEKLSTVFLIKIMEGSNSPEDLYPYLGECRKYLSSEGSPIAEVIRKTMVVPIDKWDNGIYPLHRFLAVSELVQSLRDDDVPFKRAVEIIRPSIMAYVRTTLFRMLREHLVRSGKAFTEIAPDVYVSRVHMRSLGPVAHTNSPGRRLLHPVVKSAKIVSYAVYVGKEKHNFKSWGKAQRTLHANDSSSNYDSNLDRNNNQEGYTIAPSSLEFDYDDLNANGDRRS